MEDTCVVWSAPVKGEALNLPGSPNRPFKGKLQGQFRLPFELALPTTVELPGNEGGAKQYRLPCSLSLRFTSVTINYRVYVTIKHGTLFNPEHV